MNWGWKLAVGSAMFMALIIYFVIQSFNNKTQLVSENYYEEELQFQKQIDARKNATGLDDTLFVTQKGSDIVIEYPEWFVQNDCKGTVHFYKPSNENHDKVFKFSQQEAKQIIPRSQLAPGRFQVKFNLTSSGKDYYYEKSLEVR